MCYFIVTDKTAACEAVTTWFNAQPQDWTLLDCNIECCTGDRCNDKPVPVIPVDPPVGSTVTTHAGSTVVVSHGSYQAPVTGVLAFAVTFLGAFYF